MKTIRKLLLLCLFGMISMSAWTQEFSANNEDGVTIYYRITDNVAKTCEIANGHKYQGKVSIPEFVKYNNVTYSVTRIGEEAFYSCKDLTCIIIPNSVTSIECYAFAYCSGLNSIAIPNSVKYIGYEAFYHCAKLSSITIPNSVTEIDADVFGYCSALTSINIPSTVKRIGSYTFQYCVSLASITIPNSVTIIENDAFCCCEGLTSINIPNTVKYIGDAAFAYCSNLTSITIPNSVTNIGDFAFQKCSGLTSITMPNSVTHIGTRAFDGCSSLQSITTFIENPASVTYGGSIFMGIPTTCELRVPAGAMSLYPSTYPWNGFTKISVMCDQSTDISTMDYVLYFNDVEHRAGDFDLALNMKSPKANITAFQCDIYLPEGVEWKSTADNRGNIVYDLPTFNEDRTDDSYHTIAPMVKNADGSYNIIVYSMGNVNILETDGILMTLPLSISKDMETGDYNLRIKNIVMTDVDANQVKVPEVVSKLTIPNFEIGDVNCDDEINVTDIVLTISYIRGGNPANFIFAAADVNEDGKINVTDIVNIIKIIRSTQGQASAKPRKLTLMKSATENNLEVIPFSVAEGLTSATVKLDMNNPGDEFTAFQCDVYFPEGIDWASTIDKRGNKKITNATFNAEAERTDASYHTVDVGLNANGSYNVMAYSMNNEIFLEESGAILDMPFVFDADLEPGAYDIALKNIVMTRPDGTDVKPDDYTFTILVGSPEIASATLHGDYTTDAISELNTALASNAVLSAIDFTEATSVDASTKIETGNQNLLVYVSEGTDVANSQNVVEGDECESLVLTDGYNFAAPKAFTAVSASYSRTAPSTYGTTVLPFVPSTSGAEFYELTGVTPTCFEFQKVVSPVAGTPYLYRATTDNFTATNAEIAATEAGKVTASGWTMQGTYTKEVFDASDNVYAVSDDKVYCNIGTLTMNPFRAYFTGNTSSAPMNISIDGTTVIGSIENGELAIDGAAFNLAGQKVSKSYKGIVITNGKKEIRK